MTTSTPVRCLRCTRTQPPLPPGVHDCLYCGATLPLQRWVASTPPPFTLPPGLRPRPAAGNTRRYTGPPSYGTAHPRWGMPPLRWVWHDDSPAAPTAVPPILALRLTSLIAAVVAVICALAAVAEGYRFALMLRGRTQVLSGAAVERSDLWVGLTGWLALLGCIAVCAIAVPTIKAAHRAAIIRAGQQPARSNADVWRCLAIPVYNAHGAGLILTETDDALRQAAPQAPDKPGAGTPAVHRPRLHSLVGWWWLAFALSTALALAVLIRSLGKSPQAIADSVELHIAVNAAAAIVLGLTALVAARFTRAFAGPRRSRYAGWTVLPPEPTRARQPRSESRAEQPAADDQTDSPGDAAALAQSESPAGVA